MRRFGRRGGDVQTIALLTDFGSRDVYAGVMKGVIASYAPDARVIDLSHGVPPQDVRMAAFELMASVDYFPAGTLFVCVVDPGVGTRRSIVWARGRYCQYLAPDNGLLSWVSTKYPFEELRHVTNASLFEKTISRTFHGRDIFAPVAAALATGTPHAQLGPKVSKIKTMPLPVPRRISGDLRGEVLAVDGFGNAITNFRSTNTYGKKSFYVRERKIGPLRENYASVGIGRALAVEGSSGYIELSIRQGNFSKDYSVTPGETVHVY